jgi:hypothetical protein
LDGANRVLVIKADEPALFRFNGVPDQNFDVTDRVRFQLPPDAFVHTQENAVVRIVATRADGGPLPAWLVFNPTTGTFEGVPPAGAPDELAIMVIARDAEGREASTIFRLKLVGADRLNPLGRLGITDQIRFAGERSGFVRTHVAIVDRMPMLPRKAA